MGGFNSLLEAFKSPITYLIVALFAFFLIGCVGLVFAARRRRASVIAAGAYLKFRIPQRALSRSEATEHALAMEPKVSQILENAEGERIVEFRKAWQSYMKGVIETEGLAAHRVGDYLTSERLVAGADFGPFYFGFLRVATGVFTALGLLGTFIGVAFAMSALTGDAMNSQGSLMVVIPRVVSSMSTAFWTSIFGVFLGTVNVIVVEGVMRGLRKDLTHFHDLVDRNFLPVKVEDLMRYQTELLDDKLSEMVMKARTQDATLESSLRAQNRIETTAQRQVDYLAHLKETLGFLQDSDDAFVDIRRDLSEIRSVVQGRGETVSIGLGHSLSQALHPLLERVEASVANQAGAVGAGADALEETARTMKELIEQSGRALDGGAHALEISVAEVRKALDGSDRALQSSARDLKEEASGIGQLFESAESRSKERSVKLEESVLRLEKALNSVKAQQAGGVSSGDDSAQQVKQLVAKSEKQLQKLVEQNQQLNRRNEDLQQSLKGLVIDLQEQMHALETRVALPVQPQTNLGENSADYESVVPDGEYGPGEATKEPPPAKDVTVAPSKPGAASVATAKPEPASVSATPSTPKSESNKAAPPISARGSAVARPVVEEFPDIPEADA